MSCINAGSNPGIQIFDRLQDPFGATPALILRAVIVNGNPDVILSDQFFQALEGVFGGISTQVFYAHSLPKLKQPLVGFVIGTEALDTKGIDINSDPVQGLLESANLLFGGVGRQMTVIDFHEWEAQFFRFPG